MTLLTIGKYTIQSIIEAISTLESNLKDAYHIAPKAYGDK